METVCTALSNEKSEQQAPWQPVGAGKTAPKYLTDQSKDRGLGTLWLSQVWLMKGDGLTVYCLFLCRQWARDGCDGGPAAGGVEVWGYQRQSASFFYWLHAVFIPSQASSHVSEAVTKPEQSRSVWLWVGGGGEKEETAHPRRCLRTKQVLLCRNHPTSPSMVETTCCQIDMKLSDSHFGASWLCWWRGVCGVRPEASHTLPACPLPSPDSCWGLPDTRGSHDLCVQPRVAQKPCPSPSSLSPGLSLHSICPLALGFLTPSPALLLPLFRGWIIQRISCVSIPGLIPKGWEEQSGPEISLLLEGLRKVTDMT